MGFLTYLLDNLLLTYKILKTKKPKKNILKSKSLDQFSDTSPNLINHPTGNTSPPPFYTKRSNKLQIPRLKLFPKRHPFSQPQTTLSTSTLPFSTDQHPTLPNYSTNHSHLNDNSTTPNDTLTNTTITSNTDTPIKIYSRVNYPFHPPST